MKKNLVPLLLGIAFVVAVATTGIFYGLFVGKLGAVGQVPIVVAAKNLNPGTTLTAEHLKMASWAGSSTPAGSFNSVEQAIGRTTKAPVEAGAAVSIDKLAPVGGLEGAIPPNQRAVSTHVIDSAGVLEMLHPGDHVDVQMLAGKEKEIEVRTILENRKVLAIHTLPEVTSHSAAAAPVVTLLVDQNEVDALALADSSGRVRLSLRNPKDTERSPRPALGLTNLVHSGVPAAPEPRRTSAAATTSRVN